MMLAEAIETYVQRKRAYGFLFTKGQSELSAFCRDVGDVPLHRVTALNVMDFLDAPRTGTVTWRKKYCLLNRFFDFWSVRGAMPLLLMPPPRPPLRQTFTPYIYTRTEIRSLLAATHRCQKGSLSVIDSATLRCLLLTMYATGALLGEILNLQPEDVRLGSRRIMLRGNRIMQSRNIPICSDLEKEFRSFSGRRYKGTTRSGPYFRTKTGQPINAATLSGNFQRLRHLAGIARHDGAVFQPRMRDLRATFAVHRISSWIKEGADLNRMLPALSAYMGNSSLATTEQYLSLTPERFRKELQKLSPQRGLRRWKDDAVLMKFLGSL
jgi:integrase/recombinase XerD